MPETPVDDAVRALLHRYCELQDAADFAACSALFADAVYAVAGGERCFGADAVYALKTHHDRVHDDGTLRTKHVTTNTIVEPGPGPDECAARSYFTVYQATPGLPLQAVVLGRYHDRFVRREGAWRFAERTIHVDLRGDLTGHLTDPDTAAGASADGG